MLSHLQQILCAVQFLQMISFNFNWVVDSLWIEESEPMKKFTVTFSSHWGNFKQFNQDSFSSGNNYFFANFYILKKLFIVFKYYRFFQIIFVFNSVINHD